MRGGTIVFMRHLLALALCASLVHAAYEPLNDKNRPTASEPALSPAGTAAALKVPAGFRVELVVGEPKVAATFIKPSEDGSVQLVAALADFPAPAKGGTPRFQEGETGNEVGYWDNPESSVSWDFTGAKPGEYEVLAEVSGLKDAKVFVEIGDQKLAAPLANTKNYANYKIQNLGKIRIAGAGDQRISVKPDSTDWTAFNLRKLTLKPATAH